MLTTVMFYSLAAVAVISALLVITRRNAVYSALFLVLCFFAVAGLYVMLNAQFIAAAQVIVYAGAIIVLFLFTVMLLGAGNSPGEEIYTPQTLLAWALGLVIVFQLGWLLSTFRIAEQSNEPYMHDVPAQVTDKAVLTMTPGITPGSLLAVTIADKDLDRDPEGMDSVKFTLENQNTGEKETVALTEYGSGTGYMTGTVRTTYRPEKGPDDDGIFNVSEGHVITGKYVDESSKETLEEKTVITPGAGTARTVGMTLFTKFLFPFEAVAVLLLMAMIGAVLIAKKRLKK